MKCTNCGKNNASYHYRMNVNGQVTEAHLCPECAAKLDPMREMASESRSLFGDAFGGDLFEDFFSQSPFEGFFGEGVLGGYPFGRRSLFAPLGGLFGGYAPARIEITFPEGASNTDTAPREDNTSADPELSKRREINALRAQMEEAAKAEDYERAAKLRDELRRLEGDKK